MTLHTALAETPTARTDGNRTPPGLAGKLAASQQRIIRRSIGWQPVITACSCLAKPSCDVAQLQHVRASPAT